MVNLVTNVAISIKLWFVSNFFRFISSFFLASFRALLALARILDRKFGLALMNKSVNGSIQHAACLQKRMLMSVQRIYWIF